MRCDTLVSGLLKLTCAINELWSICERVVREDGSFFPIGVVLVDLERANANMDLKGWKSRRWGV
jgi:hypothetical protein